MRRFSRLSNDDEPVNHVSNLMLQSCHSFVPCVYQYTLSRLTRNWNFAFFSLLPRGNRDSQNAGGVVQLTEDAVAYHVDRELARVALDSLHGHEASRLVVPLELLRERDVESLIVPGTP